MIQSPQTLGPRVLTLMGSGPMRAKPWPARISSTNSAYTAAATTTIHTSGVTAPATATGRAFARAQAREMLCDTARQPRQSALIVGKRSPSAFGYARTDPPHSRDSAGAVQ